MFELTLIPPLRIPLLSNVEESLSNWLEEAHEGFGSVSNHLQQQEHEQQQKFPAFTAMECQTEFSKMNSLRRKLTNRITSPDSYMEAAELVSVMHEYFAMLKKCEEHGFPSIHGTSSICLEWGDAFTDDIPSTSNPSGSHPGLLFERASILWNLAAIEAHIAAEQDLFTSSKGWMNANKHFQYAFSFIHHLQETLNNNTSNQNLHLPPDFQPQMLQFWENVLLAQAQMAGYEKVKAMPRPKHLLLSKLAKASVPLWDAAGEACSHVLTNQKAHWIHTTKVWSSYMNCKAEWHESLEHYDKKNPAHEFARLEKSLSFGEICYHYLKTSQSDERMKQELRAFLKDLHARFTDALQRLGNDPVPHDLRDIRGELLSKGATPLPKSMLETSIPMFSVMAPAARVAMNTFQREMKDFLKKMAAMVDEKSEYARRTLASVNLPHSLTAYKQEQAGGGLPIDLWERVETIQRESKVPRLKQELWELGQVANQARTIFFKTEKQLMEDLEMDRLFRENFPSFDGLDVKEVQKSFRDSLSNYKILLDQSKQGDNVLLRRLGKYSILVLTCFEHTASHTAGLFFVVFQDELDRDPKFKLLQCSKSQLDRLLPGVSESQTAIDTFLSRQLVELSNLINYRSSILDTLQANIKTYNIREKLLAVDPDSPYASQEYHSVVKKSQKSFSGIAYEIQKNISEQTPLLESIMEENQRFLAARNSNASSAASDSCITMIEEAVEEIDHLAKHLREGKSFYNVVIPKLDHLKQQVSEASVRLTVDRCEYEENQVSSTGRRRQELDDARMAALLASNACSNNDNSNVDRNSVGVGIGVPAGGGPGPYTGIDRLEQEHPLANQPGSDYHTSRDHMVAVSHPGVVNVNHNEPLVCVDDEKVASLVAMDFDADKVVAALRKYDNNVEQALNELLSC